MLTVLDRLVAWRIGPTALRSAALPVALAALFAVGLAAQTSIHIDHDVAYTLYSAGKILDGSKLYQDILDVNPPLVWYQALPTVALARAIDVSEITVYRLYICALIALSLFLANLVLTRLLEDEAAETRRFLLIALAFLLIFWARNFGQREHVMIILAMPYILLTAAAARGRAVAWPTALAIGLCAGIGVALKPYFLLLPAVLELYLMVSRRHWASWVRPDALTLGTTVAVYAASIAVFTPEYLTHMLPIGLEVYWAYNNELLEVIRAVAYMAVPLPIVFVLSRGRRRPVPQLQWVFGLAGAALAAACLIQLKGWDYQRYPVFVVLAAWALFVVGARLAGGSAHPRPDRSESRLAVLAAVAVLLIPIVTTLGQYAGRPAQHRDLIDSWVALIEEHAAGDSIYFFSSTINPAFPAVNYGRVDWASRSCCLWMLPAVVRARAEAADGAAPAAGAVLDEIEALQRESVIEDLTQWRPALVFVDVRSNKQAFRGLPFDYLEYFMSDPRFAALWSDYEELTEMPGIRVYKRRLPDPGDAVPLGG